MLLKQPDDRQPFEETFCRTVLEQTPVIETARRLALAFIHLVRDRDRSG